jgi:uncharacterized protein YecE (DUF72 family)
VASIRIGISGWTYPGWRGDFYPPGLTHRRELEYAANRFGSIEINGSFYALQRASSYIAWRDQTPRDLVFSVKAGRFITHLKKLADVETPLANFFASGVLALGPKLGPILWQLPPMLGYDEARLTTFFNLLPRTTRQAVQLVECRDTKVPDDRAWLTTDANRPIQHALEVRHISFAVPEAAALLRSHNIAVVVADSAGKWPQIEEVTSDFVYARLHGADELYVSGYTADALDRWAAKVRSWAADGHDVYVYFDNDAKVRAPYDARALMRRLGLIGAGGIPPADG